MATSEPQTTEWVCMVEQFRQAGKCPYPLTEDRHKVACGRPIGQRTSKDGLPCCDEHRFADIRSRWIGFVEGA